jgi:hypothetical protein
LDWKTAVAISGKLLPRKYEEAERWKQWRPNPKRDWRWSEQKKEHPEEKPAALGGKFPILRTTLLVFANSRLRATSFFQDNNFKKRNALMKILSCLLISILGMQNVNNLTAFYALPPTHLAFNQRATTLIQKKVSGLSIGSNEAAVSKLAAQPDGQTAPMSASADPRTPSALMANDPTDADLSRALGEISSANPEFGLRRLASALRAAHPHWRFHERRLRRLAPRSSLAPPLAALAAAPAAAPAAEKCRAMHCVPSPLPSNV